MNHDIAELRPEETEGMVQERVARALQLACQHSQQVGCVGIVTHGGPVLTLLRQLGLSVTEVERHRVYDSRNPLPPAGAWEVRPGVLRLAFVPEGVHWPADPVAPLWL